MCILIIALLLFCVGEILKTIVYKKMLQPIITHYWCIPRRIHKIMKEQKVTGPPLVNVATKTLNKLFQKGKSINIHDTRSINHDIVGLLYPDFVIWTANYGKTFFLYSNWVKPIIWLTEPKQTKEVLFRYSCVTRNTGPVTKSFIGQGVLMEELGLDPRHTLQAVFSLSKIQEWPGQMVECTENMLQQLQDKVDNGNDEIEISQYVNVLTAHIMSRTELGVSSEHGTQIAQLLNQIQEMRAQSSRHSRCIPISKYNRELKSLEVQVKEVLREMIQERVDIGQTNSHGDDLLGILLDEMLQMNMGFINMDLAVDECKNSLLAGHEANTLLITWTIMLLASNPFWQHLLRVEVNYVCKGQPPTARNLSELVRLNMVINESLRLYPPVPVIERMDCEDIWIHRSDLSDEFNFLIPKGLQICIPILAMNHSEELWGSDVNEFNPKRFAFNGYVDEFSPQRFAFNDCVDEFNPQRFAFNDYVDEFNTQRSAFYDNVEARRHFFPFAAGPHHCPAQYYALMEAKIFLAMFISKFSFTISQNYRHEPVVAPLLKPKYGVQIKLTRL